MTLYYESSDGQIIDFMSGGIYAQTPESLLDDESNYTTITGINGIGKIKTQCLTEMCSVCYQGRYGGMVITSRHT